MPGDPFKKALPGQRLVIPADAFNGMSFHPRDEVVEVNSSAPSTRPRLS
jgi:hypothetical protein